MYVSLCVFVDGEHYAGPDCPHEEQEDEEGLIPEPGWTVQQNRPQQ